MKRFLTLAAALFLVAGVSFPASAQKQQKKASADLQEVTFITSIDCANCVKKLEALLPYEKGVKDLKVNLDDRTVWFKYDASKTDKEALAVAIVKQGFSAEEVQKPAPDKNDK